MDRFSSREVSKMKFTILQNDLLEALQRISGVVPTRSTTPILENILFELDEEKLKITGTDLEISITTGVTPKKIEQTGSIALPARVITEMIRSLPAIPVQFELDETKRVRITTDQGYYQVAGISRNEFPDNPSLSEARSIELKNDLLRRMFSKTIFAVSSEELRPALMGVYMQIMPDEFRMVATDGHRLSKIIDSSFRFDEAGIQMIIPPKAVQIALKNLNEEGNIKLQLNQGGLCFIFDNTTLYTRLVEGEYPDYEKVIPRDNDKKMVVDRSLLMATVKRVSLFSSALTHQVRFSLSQNRLAVCSEDADIGGEAREELNVEYNDEPMELGYNAQYILDILKHVDDDKVVFTLKNPVRAAVVKPLSQKENESFMMLIMPIKLNSQEHQ
ncbi:MAG TPA: DNA polymerase III subunit beta [bacterium]|nr:DNA polymerase III subunit beta [bacterium]